MVTRASAKKKGSQHERAVADFFASEYDDHVDRAVKTGSVDKGDIANLRVNGHRIAVEAKNEAKVNLAGWWAEAERERDNLGAIAGIVVSKRHGKGDPGDQWVHMSLRDFVAILRAVRGE